MSPRERASGRPPEGLRSGLTGRTAAEINVHREHPDLSGMSNADANALIRQARLYRPTRRSVELLETIGDTYHQPVVYRPEGAPAGQWSGVAGRGGAVDRPSERETNDGMNEAIRAAADQLFGRL